MTLRTAILAAFSALAVHAPLAAEKIETLELKNGKTYSGVTITKKTAIGISITHASGTARIPFEELPADLQEKLGGFDKEAAEKAMRDEKEREARRSVRLDRAREEAELRQREIKASKPAVVRVVQALGSGALCKVAWVVEEGTKIQPFDKPMIYIDGLSGVVDGQELTALLLEMRKPRSYEAVNGAVRTVRQYRLIRSSVGGGE